MRLPKTVPSPPLVGRAYGKNVHLSAAVVIRLVAIATGLILPAYPFSRTYSAAVRRPVEPGAYAAAYAASSGGYDCSVGGQGDAGKQGRAALGDGIDGAFEILESCPACKDFYGDADPAELLKTLVKGKRIVVADGIPEYFKWDRFSRRWRAGGKLKPFKPKQVAAVAHFVPTNMSGEIEKPCIYVNSSLYLGSDRPFAADRQQLRRERALVVLHELAHILNVIPRDGSGPLAEWKSGQNHLCIKRNCSPCAAKSVTCVHEPEPRPAPRRRGPGANSVPGSSRLRRQL